MRITRRKTWPQLREVVSDDLRRALQGDALAVAGPDADACVTWADGPSFSTVAAAVGNPPGWMLAFWPEFLPPPEPPQGHAATLLRLRRSFSDAALAVAVVRFAASNVRPFDAANPAHHAPMTAILDVDDPARCDYPLIARVAELLLDAAGPATASGEGNPADRLARALEAAGYEALWNEAWAEVDL